MDINLRKAQESDVDFLLDLRVATMREYLEKDGIPCTNEENLHRIKHNFDDAKIIEVDGQMAGLFKASYLDDRNQWHLFQVQIHPNFQNMKIGSHLIKELIKVAKEQGKSVGLSVLKSNPAYNLYDKLGFQIIEDNEHEYEMELKA
ncbi:N-acetyltransferase [Photobacterium sp. OFAV2-7]|uniref:GNAT family N-acetyltransferase n=1 Tax=Photobacterium sp. OFAV2-7 TaxID=2917748 RepID=UPI001EF4EAA6|nr:N-acetyltransferase [Photobacterium sp. OFAV2-7]MCG7587515.1 GNAT family N-acetyltransferase [Photobacterium sp. OFAV2-7]